MLLLLQVLLPLCLDWETIVRLASETIVVVEGISLPKQLSISWCENVAYAKFEKKNHGELRDMIVLRIAASVT